MLWKRELDKDTIDGIIFVVFVDHTQKCLLGEVIGLAILYLIESTRWAVLILRVTVRN